MSRIYQITLEIENSGSSSLYFCQLLKTKIRLKSKQYTKKKPYIIGYNIWIEIIDRANIEEKGRGNRG